MDKEKNKRKLFLVLPLLILPFLALAFYALGGGKSNPAENSLPASNGFNTRLPGAQFKNEKNQDKMTLYDKAIRDSASARSSNKSRAFAALGWDTSGQKKANQVAVSNAQASEQKITQKLAEINRQINSPEPVKSYTNPADQGTNSAQLDRLEKIIRQKSEGNAPDPEMQQLNNMLEKIEDIQHPERVSAQLKKEIKAEPDSIYKAIRAVVVSSQKVIQGSSVELRLTDTITIKGQVIPKGHLVYGLCQVTNQRLLLNIKNIRLGTSILPVDLVVYDMDGMPGIRAPDAVTQDAMRSGTDNAVQSMDFMPMDETVGTEAAGAGVAAAKTLFSKKVKVIRVKLKAGYPVLLRNNQVK